MLGATVASAQVLHPHRIASTSSLGDDEMYYTYDDGETTSGMWGTGKKENYDVAIHVVEPALVGKTVEGMVVYMNNDTKLSNLKVWLTKELALDSDKQNVADITSKSADVATGEIEVRFDKPYTITSDGFYAGYSVNVDDLDGDNNKYPIYCTYNSDAESFYIHTSRTYRKWVAKGETLGLGLCLKVIIKGAEPIAAGPSLKSSINGEINKATTTSVTIKNHGTSTVSSIDYTYKVNGSTTTGSYTFDTPLAARYGAAASFDIELPAIKEAGKYPVTFTIDKVNGSANADQAASTEATLNVYKILPIHCPVMEEYTGTWCGYCPRGFVGMEYMGEHYPDFIGIAYHNSDDMEVMSSSKYPSSVSGFPSAFLDRDLSLDAFYGTSGSKNFGVADDWQSRADEMAPAKIEVNAGIADDANTVKVRTEVTFIDTHEDPDFHLEYALVANDLYDESWYQSNYYSGSTGLPEEFDVFTEGGSKVYGLHYNDVIVASSRLGQAGSADSEMASHIMADKTLFYTCEFKLDEVKNTSGEAVIQNNANLVVVSMLIDGKTGHIVNAAKANVSTDPNGVSSVKADEEAPATYYDLSGRKVNTPSKGIFIKKTADGKAQKIMLK